MTARWSEASQPTNFLSKGFTQPRWWLKISVLQHSTNASNLAPLSSWRASATVAEMPYFSSSSSAAWSKVTQEERHREMFITKSNTTSTVENTWKFNPSLRASRKRPPIDRMASVPSRPSRAILLSVRAQRHAVCLFWFSDSETMAPCPAPRSEVLASQGLRMHFLVGT